MLDIFNNNAFTVHSMTDSINLAPYAPSRLGDMGLFNTKHPTTHTVMLERRGNLLSLIPSKVRGSGETTKRPAGLRDIRPILLPYVPYDDSLLASDISGARAFEEESQVEIISAVLNEKLATMRQDHEATHEWLRVGAVKGIILDGDGTTTLANLFTEFGISQKVEDFNFGTATEKVKKHCVNIIRYIEDILGGGSYDHIHAICGNTWWDWLTSHVELKEAYGFQMSGYQTRYLSTTQGQGTKGRGTSQLEFADITFENYRGSIGGTPGQLNGTKFVADAEAYFFPVGVNDLFTQYFGPASTVEGVNKPGKTVFAMQAPMKWDAGIEIHTESNPMMLCKRPSVLVKGISTAVPAGLLFSAEEEAVKLEAVGGHAAGPHNLTAKHTTGDAGSESKSTDAGKDKDKK